MTRERIQSLDELDFEWQLRSTRTWESTNNIVSDGGSIHNKNVPQQGHANKPSLKHSIKWEKSRQQLVDFKVKYRHTNVPAKYAENKPLGTWVSTQRTQYKLFKEKRKSSMTRERIQSLDELDFEWELRSTRTWELRSTRTWEENRQELVDFKKKYRHTNVPAKYAENRPLGRWVDKQRYEYKLFKAKRKNYDKRTNSISERT